MSEYDVVYTNLKTGQVLGRAPVISLTAMEELNEPEGISVVCPLSFNPSINAPVEIDTTTIHTLENFRSGARGIFIRRDEVIIFGGVLWSVRNIDFFGETMELSAEGMLSYLNRRDIRNNLTYAAKDQDFIARELVDYASGVAITTSANLHGVLRDRTYLADDRASVGERLSQLAAVENGFDFRWVHTLSGTTITSSLVTSYPASGRSTNNVFQLGNLESLVMAKDGSGLANLADALGETQIGGRPLIETSINSSATAIYPQLDKSQTFSGVNVRATLQDRANRMIQRGRNEIVSATLTMNPNDEPSLGSYVVGDRVRIIAKHGAANVDQTMRIVGRGVSVTVDGKESVAVSLVSEEVFL